MVTINVTVSGQGGQVLGTSIDSGFVLDMNGHIATNNHVVSGATEIETIRMLELVLVADRLVNGIEERACE